MSPLPVSQVDGVREKRHRRRGGWVGPFLPSRHDGGTRSSTGGARIRVQPHFVTDMDLSPLVEGSPRLGVVEGTRDTGDREDNPRTLQLSEARSSHRGKDRSSFSRESKDNATVFPRRHTSRASSPLVRPAKVHSHLQITPSSILSAFCAAEGGAGL